MAGWQHRHGNKRFSARQLAALAGVSHPAVYRIREGQGTPDQTTLDKLAGYFGLPAPQRAVVVGEGEVAGPQSALEWIRRARAAIDEAERLLLREEGTIPPEDETAAILRAHEFVKEQARKAAGKGRRKAG
jgi:transcriptional regulator with XRE-family HTH domain